MKKISKITLFLIIILIIINSYIANAQEYTVYDGPSDIEEKIINQGNYQYIEERDELKPNVFQEIMDSELSNEFLKISDFLNYKKWQFWFLLGTLFLIFLILIRLFIKLSKMNKKLEEYKKHFKKNAIEQDLELSKDDEVIYSPKDHDE